MAPSSLRLAIAPALAGLSATAAAGCGPTSQATTSTSSTAHAGADVGADQQAYTRLLNSAHTGHTQPAELVLRDPEAFAAAWHQLHEGQPEGERPTVDFGSRMVVLLALGERGSGGHAVRFEEMVREGGDAVVRYTVTAPGPNCMTTQAITAPADVVSVPRVAGTVRFERRMVTEPC